MGLFGNFNIFGSDKKSEIIPNNTTTTKNPITNIQEIKKIEISNSLKDTVEKEQTRLVLPKEFSEYFEEIVTILPPENANRTHTNAIGGTIYEYDFVIDKNIKKTVCEINRITNSHGLDKREVHLDLDGDGKIDNYLISDHGEEGLIFQQISYKEGSFLPSFESVSLEEAKILLETIRNFIVNGQSVNDEESKAIRQQMEIQIQSNE